MLHLTELSLGDFITEWCTGPDPTRKERNCLFKKYILGSLTANPKGEIVFFMLKDLLSWILELEKRAERKLMLIIYPHVPGILHILFKPPNKSFKAEITFSSLNSDRSRSDNESPILEVMNMGFSCRLLRFPSPSSFHHNPITSSMLSVQQFIREWLLKKLLKTSSYF